MLPFNLNAGELIVIAVLFLLLFGPEKLPEIAMQVGRIMRELRDAAQTASGEISRELESVVEEHSEVNRDIREAGDTATKALREATRMMRDPIGTTKRKALEAGKERVKENFIGPDVARSQKGDDSKSEAVSESTSDALGDSKSAASNSSSDSQSDSGEPA